jgi:hypothetical protein
MVYFKVLSYCQSGMAEGKNENPQPRQQMSQLRLTLVPFQIQVRSTNAGTTLLGNQTLKCTSQS